ncbi:hypothetical protein TWF730_002705 [Orbilia blumenaviensis]|uniref:Uncharacterized protein n=1 Tax=Orbilia blumenaviensis TaxID=1796055 RepID=A0AAV9U7P9_9PEZI
MSLSSGSYYIMGSFGTYKYSVGRAHIEDRSLNPKQIYLLHPSPLGMTPWDIIKTSHGYVFQARNAPTGSIDGIRGPTGQYWTVEDRVGLSGHRIVLREDGEGSQTFTIIRAYRDFSEEEEKYSHQAEHHSYGPEKDLDDDRQSRFGYGKREKKFCS